MNTPHDPALADALHAMADAIRAGESISVERVFAVVGSLLAGTAVPEKESSLVPMEALRQRVLGELRSCQLELARFATLPCDAAQFETVQKRRNEEAEAGSIYWARMANLRRAFSELVSLLAYDEQPHWPIDPDGGFEIQHSTGYVSVQVFRSPQEKDSSRP
ncbi:hypothetical protein K7574_00420 [Stenotrophomonas maltophilia]|uniref:hypothetical protein n=1 Tax=Stenotrophomonas maltophilia TaxID=40324 RepID=UPI001D0C1303|nr:hypothetical protein [Stenotrophomonas maltophilia]UXF72566.1 hypothetical protein K7574_00420 [Stenotrophomonas maltophilia]